MNDFRRALDAVIAEITPQPWDYTTPDGVTLTVIPVGLREDPGEAEVTIRITADKATAVRADVTTTDLPDLIAGLTEQRRAQVVTWVDDSVIVRPDGTGVLIAVTETTYGEDRRPSQATLEFLLPAEQRLPLASALRRALDVARGWEG